MISTLLVEVIGMPPNAHAFDGPDGSYCISMACEGWDWSMTLYPTATSAYWLSVGFTHSKSNAVIRLSQIRPGSIQWDNVDTSTRFYCGLALGQLVAIEMEDLLSPAVLGSLIVRTSWIVLLKVSVSIMAILDGTDKLQENITSTEFPVKLMMSRSQTMHFGESGPSSFARRSFSGDDGQVCSVKSTTVISETECELAEKENAFREEANAGAQFAGRPGQDLTKRNRSKSS